MAEVKYPEIRDNVLYAGLYSAEGASYQILRAIEREQIQIILSTTLFFEYEDVLIDWEAVNENLKKASG
jgi:predicted nucleic acid-binding protein